MCSVSRWPVDGAVALSVTLFEYLEYKRFGRLVQSTIFQPNVGFRLILNFNNKKLVGKFLKKVRAAASDYAAK